MGDFAASRPAADLAEGRTRAEDDWCVLDLGLSWVRCRLEDHIAALRSAAPASRDAGSAAMTDLEADWLLRKPALRAAVSEKSEAARQAYDAKRKALRATGALAAMDRLSALFGLAPFDEDLLLLAAAPHFEGAFAALFGYAHDRLALQSASLHLAQALLVPLEAAQAARARLSPNAPLRRFKLIDLPQGGPGSLSPISVDERIAHYLAGSNELDKRVAGHLRPLRAGALPSRFAARVESLSERMLAQNRATAFLVGPRRSGRRAAAAAVARRFGADLLELDAEALVSEQEPRHLQLALLAREARLCGLALVLDLDASGAVESAAARRKLVDDLLLALDVPLFLLSEAPTQNAVPTIIEHFEALTPADRAELWRDAIGSRSAEGEAALEAIAEQFALGPAEIARIAETQRGTPVTQFWQVCRRTSRVALDGLAERIEPRFTWADIVLPTGIAEELKAIAAQARGRSTVYGQWGFGRKLVRGRGVTALFAGASGVGKTMAAEVIARELDLDLHRVDLAGVVSKYIGETEKNLRRVFDEAQAAGAVLFFDEADALFGKRSEVKDSHDRYANVEVSYLLQRMETFDGVSILATNMKSHIDSAFLRRLRYVVDFQFPDAALRREIWARSFPVEAPTEELDFDRLSRIEMAGGSIAVAAVNAAFMAAAENGSIRMVHLARAAEAELRKHGKEQRLTWLHDGVRHA